MKRRPSGYRRLHRLLGVSAAAILILLVFSGLALQHLPGASRAYVQAPWLLDWYGIEAPADYRAFAADRHRVTRLGERTFLDEQALSEAMGPLQGAAFLHGQVAIADTTSIWLFTPEAALIDRIDAPAPVDRVGTAAGGLVVQTTEGLFAADDAIIEWTRAPAAEAEWSRAADLPPARLSTLQARYLTTALPWERVLADFHSGRLFGWIGRLVVDLATVALLALAVTGLILATRPRRRQGSGP